MGYPDNRHGRVVELDSATINALLSYDPETGRLFWLSRNSNRTKIGDEAGTLAGNGYRYVSICGHRVLVHRLIFFIQTGAWPTGIIDHKDCDPLNNRWSNLRDCNHKTNAENKQNPQSNNRLGVLGVSLSRGKFKAQIQVNKKNKCIGRFDTIEDAEEAYLSAKRNLHEGYI